MEQQMNNYVTMSQHFYMERMSREAVIQMIGEGRPIREIIVDRHHKDGPERHVLTDNAIILIYNQRTNKLVTKLIARPGQLRKFYNRESEIPLYLKNKAMKHQRSGYNLV